MNTPLSKVSTHIQTAVLSTNKVVSNTYMLLSMTLLFSTLRADQGL